MKINDLVNAAASEGWRVRPPELEKHPILSDRGDVVGFFCPHSAGRGRWRVGPIYVHPSHRGRGLAAQAYSWADGVPLVAYTHVDNKASARVHEKLGFVRWYTTRSGGQYWKRD
jgi:RimJ/RimL family protein N-acetyltransferase